MRVGVDATGWANRRGFGRFARNAVGRLIATDAGSEYVLYIDAASAADVELPAGAGRRTVALARRPARAAAAHSARSPADLLRMTAAVRRDRPDVFLFPSVQTWFPVFGTPAVVGVHDTIARTLPELTLPSRRARALWRLKEGMAIRTAAGVFTVSQASRAAIVRRFGLDGGRLAVVPEAPDPVFAPRAEGDVAAHLAQLGLERERYFLFVGGISPHKNLLTLLDAYAALRGGAGADGEVPRLVLVGELEDDPYLSAAAAVRERIADHGLASSVVLTGFVSDETLACLYTGATAVVLPSLAEGFDLPAVEAAACGAPVLASDLDAHRETLGGAALFFAAADAPAIAAAMARVAADAALRADLSSRAQAAIAGLSWDLAAERLHAVISRTAAPGG